MQPKLGSSSMEALDASFPKRRCSAGGLILDSDGYVLVVKPSYREDWLLPGGVVELGETPAQAVIRETREETGLRVSVISLLAIDSLVATGDFGESVHFLFHCKAGPDADTRLLMVDGTEIVEARFMHILEAGQLLAAPIWRRLQAVLAGQIGYFEDGIAIAPFADANVTVSATASISATP